MSASAERVQKYLDERAKIRGLHPELIHTLNEGDETREAFLLVSDLRAALSAPALPEPAVKAGWRWVPVEPTDAMGNAGLNALEHYAGGSASAVAGAHRGVWAQMLAAAPEIAETGAAGATPDECIELAQALEQQRALKIAETVQALSIGGKDVDMSTPFHAGFQTACDEIIHRLRTEEWELCLPPVDSASRVATEMDHRSSLNEGRNVINPSLEEIRGAVARGWCSPTNECKTMDSDLALAIADEIAALWPVDPPQPAQEPVAWMVEFGAVSLPAGHPSRVTGISFYETEAEAQVAVDEMDFNSIVTPLYATPSQEAAAGRLPVVYISFQHNPIGELWLVDHEWRPIADTGPVRWPDSWCKAWTEALWQHKNGWPTHQQADPTADQGSRG